MIVYCREHHQTIGEVVLAPGGFPSDSGRSETDSTNANGRYAVGGTSEAGRYRAIAKSTIVGSGDSCLKAISSTVRN